MNTEEEKTGIKTGEKRDTKSEQKEDITKIPITKEAEKLFSELVELANKGFEAGRIGRRDVASWIIARFHKTHTDGDIREMRQDHLSEELLLESFYKKMKDVSQLPPEVRKLLLSILNVDNPEKPHTQAKKRVKIVPPGGENEAAS